MSTQNRFKNTKEATKLSGSEALMLSFINEGVDLIWGYPGGANMIIYDAMMDFEKEITHILTRHEQGALHAAQGYARVSGRVGVAMATSGPGATNTITGLADAMLDSTPLVLVTGQVASPLLGTDAFQEIDVLGITMPITKWNYQITNAEEVPEIMAKAFYIARSGRPGPVLIDITKDAQKQQIKKYSYKEHKAIRGYIPTPEYNISNIDEAANLVNKAKKPFILIGQGVILGNAEKEMISFLDKTGIPAAYTMLGLSAIPSTHPQNVGMLGMHGNYAPNIKTNECDLLIAIGMRFDDRVTGDLNKYAKQAKVIHMDIDPAEINKIVKADVPVIGNVKDTLPLLTERAKNNTHQAWLKEFKDAYKIELERVIDNDLHPKKGNMRMGEVISKVSEATDNKAILVTDVGQHQMACVRYFNFSQSRSLVTSGGLGTMGFGLPAAMGAKLGAPERTVVCFCGDGGLQMTIQEFGTIFQSKIEVKVILLNNTFLGMVRQWQDLFFNKRYAETTLVNPDFMQLAEGFRVNSKKVEKREDLDAGIKEMLETPGAFLLEVSIEKEANIFPMVPTGASVSDIILEKK